MKSTRIATFLAVTLICSAGFAGDRVLNESFPSGEFKSLAITNGVGSVTVKTTDNEVIEVEVTLIPRRGGIFSSMSRAEEEVAAAELKANQGTNTLSLEMDSKSNEPRFEARWVISTPSRIHLELEQGVGDVSVEGLAGGIDMEVGVGEVTATIVSGDVGMSLGVGDAVIRAPVEAYGSVDVSGGVGGTRVVVNGDVTKGEGFVSHSSRWRGDGPDSIELEVGVGDAEVILD